MNPTSYKELLKAFLTNGFYFKKFENFNVNEDCQIILRHDVDFNIQMALQMATVEKKIGVLSTYFFLLSSDSYNLFSRKNSEAIKSIQNMGHSIGLHFDPTVYVDEKGGFVSELNLFEKQFGKTMSMSFHRPSKTVLDGVGWLPQRILSAYQYKFFNEITYISDSQGAFRYGHPFEHKSFNTRKNIQLLIHPIWWMTDAAGPLEKIEQYLKFNTFSMSEHISQNCIPWRERNV